jgi:alpha-beta hydrolase superfamily lysophospholipase
LLLVGVVAVSGVAQDRDRVTFQTADGRTLAATFYEPDRRPAPAVILVHMLGRSRRDWDEAASELASAGIAALAIDLRGHGESTGPAGADTDRARLAAMVADVKAAKRFLETRSDVLRDRVGVAGASLGASLAALAAADEAGIRSIALLSPAIDYRGLRIDAAMRKYAPRRALLVASRDDPYAWRSMRELAKDQPTRQMVLFDRAGHGTTMLAREESLVRTLVDWFGKTLL